MFTLSSFCPTLGWEYPIDQIVKDQSFPYNLNLDSTFLVDFSTSSQAQNYGDHHHHHHQFDHDHHVKRTQSDESPNGTSSNDHQSSLLAKKLSHNASERVRRKKISNLYSSLRALLPTNHLKKKLSIPGTVVKVVEYIPELQQEVEDLIRKKEELLSKLSKLQGNARDFILEEKPKNCIINETTSFSISANKLGDKDLMIQISSFETIYLYEALLLLEKNGYFVVDVSSFQSFGGITFYNIHLSMEGSFTKNVQQLNEALQSLIQEQKQKQLQHPKIHFDLLNF